MSYLSRRTQASHDRLVRIARRASMMDVIQYVELNREGMEEIQEVYLDWVNNYITASVFAEHYHLTEKGASKVIALGKDIHEALIR